MTEEKHIDTHNGKIYYWRAHGRRDLPTLVFLHGLSSNHLTWQRAAALAHERGHSTIALDLRGHGLSDKARSRRLYTIPVMREDVRQVLEREGVTDFALVGYSYGAYVALDFVRTYPGAARALVLISANMVSPFMYHWFFFITYPARFLTDLLGWFLIWQKRKSYYYFEPESAKTRGYWKSTFAGYATMPLSINFWMLSEVFGLDLRRGLDRAATPTLIIRGENDAFITERETRDLAKLLHAKVATLGLGHYVASHYQELCAHEMLTFIDSLQ